MPRRPRIILTGVAHHVTQRGNNREAVFHSADDRRFYLDLLGLRGQTHFIDTGASRFR
jgi:putative transposase